MINVSDLESTSLRFAYGVDARVWIDLERVNVVTRVLKETVVWIEHFM